MNQKHYIGEKSINNFGSEMIISRYDNPRDIDVFFPAYNWTAKNVYCTSFIKGKLRCPYEPRLCNVGYIGEGPYTTKHPAYKTWTCMIRRCYDNSSSYNIPTYNDCTVCSEWHNFQNFAQWYDNNYYEIDNDKMQLDKDIIIKNNKIYSPDTCCFVNNIINSMLTNKKRFRNGIIGSYKRNGKYEVSCENTLLKKRQYLGRFSTEDEAFNAYKNYKEENIKAVADYYKDKIPDHLYIALYNYEIDIND